MKKSPFVALATLALGLSLAAGIQANQTVSNPVFALDPHEHDNVTFTSWTSSTSLPSTTGSYFLENDVVISDDTTIQIPDGVTVSICLNGKSVKNTSTTSQPLFRVKGGGKLNIFDCGTDEHKYSLQKVEQELYEAVVEEYFCAVVDDTLTADYETFKGGYFTNFMRPIVKIDESTKSGDGLVWSSGSVVGSKDYSVFEVTGNINIKKGNFLGNDTGHGPNSVTGSVVRVFDKGVATLGKDAFFADNSGMGSGACVYGEYGSKVTISSTFKNNFGARSTVFTEDEIKIDGAVFQGNKSPLTAFGGSGSAVEIYREENTKTTKGTTINNCTFKDNSSAKLMGGAIRYFVYKEIEANSWINNLSVSNCIFEGNYSEQGASAIYMYDRSKSHSYLDISDCTFTSNYNTGTDTTYSGAVYYCADSAYDAQYNPLPTNARLNIYGSTFTDNHCVKAGALRISTSPKCTMKATLTDVTMTNNKATDGAGGAIHIQGSGKPEDLLLSLQEYCSIKDNTATTFGGGVYADNAVVEINDHSAIALNKVGDKDNNVYLAKYNPFLYPDSETGAFINVKYKLRDGASIGVSMEEPGDFTRLLGTTNNGLATEALEYFFSDDENYEVEINETNNQLTLSGGPAEHVHNWSYSASGATITATCTGGECPDSPISITIIPPANLAYDGTAKKAMLESTKSWSGILTPGTMKYFKGSQEVSECIEPGTYTAKYTMGGATATLDFTITGGGDTPTTNPTIVDPNNNNVLVEFEENVDVTNVELRVEVRAQVKEKDNPEQYNIIVKKLGENEEIAKVYDVRLIRKVGDVETEIQPSDLKPGLKLKVHMAIPEGLDVTNMRILHIHSLTDMEFVSNYVKEGNDLVFEISKLSQFAFIKKVNAPAPQPQPQPTKSGLPAGAVVGIVLGSILLLCLIAFLLLFFVFAKFIIVKDKDGNDVIVRAIRFGKEKQDNQNDKEYFKLMTFKFKKELRVEDEIFNKKKDAEEFVDEQQGLSKNIDDRK